jgi:oligoendopeptidase F
MKTGMLRVTALLLAVTLLFSGCALDFAGYFDRLAGFFGPVSFDRMEYTRPDLSGLDEALEKCLDSAKKGDNLNALVGHITTVNSICSNYRTNYFLAYIRYSIDMTDSYWETEYNHCSQLENKVQSSVDELMYALAASPLREELEDDAYFGAGYFDDYEGESLWTEAFTALMDQETELVNRYYELSAQSLMMDVNSEEYYTTVGNQLAQVYVELAKLRLQIAKEAGYKNYTEFAYDFVYNRDYTGDQTAALLADIRTELVPEYDKLEGSLVWVDGLTSSQEQLTLRYVKTMAEAMGGMVGDAFEQMDEGNLYHIAYSENKYDASFEVFLPDYMVPFVFMKPTLTSQDHLTFAHEFGHFCRDYATYGGGASIDIDEFFSQGLEYLSLFYADGGKDLAQMKLASSLCVYVEQAALAEFEDRVYRLSAQELTVENVQALYAAVSEDYGFADMVDARSYVNIPHLFASPLYVISYVVSNDVALQLYQKELTESGSGWNCYRDNLGNPEEEFLAFVEDAGLNSPFRSGHIKEVRTLFKNELKL